MSFHGYFCIHIFGVNTAWHMFKILMIKTSLAGGLYFIKFPERWLLYNIGLNDSIIITRQFVFAHNVKCFRGQLTPTSSCILTVKHLPFSPFSSNTTWGFWDLYMADTCKEKKHTLMVVFHIMQFVTHSLRVGLHVHKHANEYKQTREWSLFYEFLFTPRSF